MSRPKHKEEDHEDSGNLPLPYEVGYGKPPAEHRFQKGRSGNPKGRPRNSKNKPKPLNPAHQPTDRLILEDAYRMVAIREGDKVIELPAIQASVRAMAISAMKGSRLSQRELAGLVRQVEDRQASEHLSALENAFEYRQNWTAELERRKRLGIDEPDPVPHPDDIIIDMHTGHVRIEGPLDELQKRRWDLQLARRAEAQVEVNCCADHYHKARSEQRKAMWLLEWHYEQRIFDIINDGMPSRYKVKLQNRSYSEGASEQGKTLDEFRERKMKK